VVFDLRLRFADWEACVDILGQEVLRRLYREDRRFEGRMGGA
jgi:hypothetical protein